MAFCDETHHYGIVLRAAREDSEFNAILRTPGIQS